MARKTQIIVIDAEGRDHGKNFFIREMPASQAEKWAMRAFLALASAGVEIPDDLAASGLAGVASIGLKALGRLHFSDAHQLMDEMMGCVQVIPDSSRPGVTRALIEDDIEEVSTRIRLRKEVFALHVDFFIKGKLSI